jgi:hypothetical protein
MAGMAAMLVALGGADRCDHSSEDSDSRQQALQEHILREGVSQTGMPAIKNFRERKILKEILEMRDQADLVTYTYLFAQQSGQLVFLCDSIGYGFPAATQYTSPQKLADQRVNYGYLVLPQADPNGLFSPSSAEGTWVMCKDPNGTTVKPVYVEERITVAPFRLGRLTAQPERDGK